MLLHPIEDLCQARLAALFDPDLLAHGTVSEPAPALRALERDADDLVPGFGDMMVCLPDPAGGVKPWVRGAALLALLAQVPGIAILSVFEAPPPALDHDLVLAAKVPGVPLCRWHLRADGGDLMIVGHGSSVVMLAVDSSEAAHLVACQLFSVLEPLTHVHED